MVPTLNFVTERFNYFNCLIFKPALPPIRIRIGSGRRALGSFRYPRNIRPGQKRTGDLCTLTISSAYDRPIQELEDTIIHEMIHYMIWLNAIDEPAHGPEFRKAMNQINSTLNRNITIRNHEELEHNEDKNVLRVILSAKMPDGNFGIACVARTRVLEFEKWLKQQGIEHTWWYTTDPFFTRYPLVRTLKFYKIAPEDYTNHVLTAFPLNVK